MLQGSAKQLAVVVFWAILHAQNITPLGHHLKTDFKMLECILDDDPDKDGMTYKNVPVEVKYTKSMDVPKNSSFLITSLENIRPIYRRILELHPRRVLLPSIC